MKNMKSIFAVLSCTLLLASCAKEALTPADAIAPRTDELALAPEENILDDAGLAALFTPEQAVGSRSQESTVYTLSNEPGGNEVIAFSRDADGSISESGRYATGGNGSGGGLGNQGALALSKTGNFLFVVNPGSNEISYFSVNGDGSLTLRDKAGSGGYVPISITVHNGLIYVLNAGGTGNITGFGINGQGQLMPLSNSTRALSSSAAGAAQVSFSPNGKALVVTEKATNTISSFAVKPNGRPGALHTFPAAGITPFGFDFGNNNKFYVSEASGGAPGASTVSTYQVNNAGVVSLVDGPFATNGSAACWAVLTNNKQTLFVTNTASSDVSSLSVSGSGQLGFGNGGNTTPAFSAPIDAAVDKTSKYLYVLANGTNAILSYSVGNDGTLLQIDEDGDSLPDAMTGLVVR